MRLDEHPEVISLLQAVDAVGELRYGPDFSPGSLISFIRQVPAGRRIDTAVWWLCLDARTMKPDSRYASFNSRSDKLDVPGSLAYRPYRSARCIVPATAFIEGLGDKKTYHQIEDVGRAIAFGALYKEWLNRESGELVYSVSIITLPPMPGLENIAPKSIPLMLDYENSKLIDQWLAPDFKEVRAFMPLLKPQIRQEWRATPIGKASLWNAIGESFMLPGEPV